MAADDLALLAHRLHRRSYLHGPFPRVWPVDALWLPREQPLRHHGWRARRGIAHARTVEDSKGTNFRATRPRLTVANALDGRPPAGPAPATSATTVRGGSSPLRAYRA